MAHTQQVVPQHEKSHPSPMTAKVRTTQHCSSSGELHMIGFVWVWVRMAVHK